MKLSKELIIDLAYDVVDSIRKAKWDSGLTKPTDEMCDAVTNFELALGSRCLHCKQGIKNEN